MKELQGAWIIVIFLLFSVSGESSSLAVTPTTGTAWVQIMPGAKVPHWKALALEGAVSHFVGEFERLNLAQNIPPIELKCIENSPCLLSFARDHNINLVLVGRLEGRDLTLKAYETWTNSLVTKSTLSLHEGMSLTEFRHRVFKLIRPFIEIGGLIDQHGGPKLNPDQRAAENTVVQPNGLIWLTLAVPLFLFFWIPRFFYTSFIRKRTMKKRVLIINHDIKRMDRVLFLSTFGIIVLWLLVPHFLSPPTEVASALGYVPKDVVRAWPAVKFFKGGAAWASVLLLGFSFVSSRMRGLERVGHLALFPVLRSWLVVFVGKFIVLSFAWLPFIYGAQKFSQSLNLDTVTTWAIVVPFAILFGTLWFLLWLGYFTLIIDDRLASGATTDENPWHHRIKKYFRGYLNRSQIQINENVFESALYLPAKPDIVVTYGGGFLRPRILLSSWMLPYVMGPLPGRQEDEDTGFSDLMTGLVFPQKRKKTESTGFSFTSFLKFKDKEIEPTPFRAQAAHPFNLRKATILGYILPYHGDEAAPLIANNRDDFDVVTELMTEHYLQFDKDQEELELDDTEPTDKDFLFGLLMREQGTIEHQDQFFTTFSLGLAYFCQDLPRRFIFLKNWGSRLRRLYNVNLSKYAILLADSYAAFHHGRNHLVQYLYYRLAGRRQLFSSRADSGYLYSISQNIFESVGQLEPTKESRYIRYASFEHRIHWMAELFFGKPPAATQTFHRRLFRGLVILLVVSATALPIANAFRYHDVYLKRMQDMREKINKQQTQLQERENVRKQQQ